MSCRMDETFEHNVPAKSTAESVLGTALHPDSDSHCKGSRPQRKVPNLRWHPWLPWCQQHTDSCSQMRGEMQGKISTVRAEMH